MDALDPIADPSGGYLAVYQYATGIDRGAALFDVGIARSKDLVRWTCYRDTAGSPVALARGAADPTLRQIPGTGWYVLAVEQYSSRNPYDHVRVLAYPRLAAVLKAAPARVVDLPRRLSRWNEGTPNLLSMGWNGGIARSLIRIGFHWESPSGACPGRDREATGTLAGFWTASWSPRENEASDNSLNRTRVDGQHGSIALAGSHGQFRQFTFRRAAFRIYEAHEEQRLPTQPPCSGEDFKSWHLVLDDLSTKRVYPLTLQIGGGQSIASVGNPTAAVLPAPTGSGKVLVITAFVFYPLGRNGPLIYYRRL